MSVFKILLFTALFFPSVPVLAGGFSLSSDTLHTSTEQKTDHWLALDKALHVTGSMMFMSALSIHLRRRVGFSQNKALRFGFGFTFALGAVKEIWDDSKPDNRFSYKDLTANLIGACIGAFLVSRD